MEAYIQGVYQVWCSLPTFRNLRKRGCNDAQVGGRGFKQAPPLLLREPGPCRERHPTWNQGMALNAHRGRLPPALRSQFKTCCMRKGKVKGGGSGTREERKLPKLIITEYSWIWTWTADALNRLCYIHARWLRQFLFPIYSMYSWNTQWWQWQRRRLSHSKAIRLRKGLGGIKRPDRR
jgi:hypothetical protein